VDSQSFIATSVIRVVLIPTIGVLLSTGARGNSLRHGTGRVCSTVGPDLLYHSVGADPVLPPAKSHLAGALVLQGVGAIVPDVPYQREPASASEHLHDPYLWGRRQRFGGLVIMALLAAAHQSTPVALEAEITDKSCDESAKKIINPPGVFCWTDIRLRLRRIHDGQLQAQASMFDLQSSLSIYRRQLVGLQSGAGRTRRG